MVSDGYGRDLSHWVFEDYTCGSSTSSRRMAGGGGADHENDSSAVADGEFVVAGCDTSPLFELLEASLDHVTCFVGLRAERGGSASSGTMPFTVSDVIRFSGIPASVPRSRRSFRFASEVTPCWPSPGQALYRGGRYLSAVPQAPITSGIMGELRYLTADCEHCKGQNRRSDPVAQNR